MKAYVVSARLGGPASGRVYLENEEAYQCQCHWVIVVLGTLYQSAAAAAAATIAIFVAAAVVGITYRGGWGEGVL